MREVVRKARSIWKELDNFSTFRPEASIIKYLEHLFACKGDSIWEYSVLYPYIIIAFYLRPWKNRGKRYEQRKKE